MAHTLQSFTPVNPGLLVVASICLFCVATAYAADLPVPAKTTGAVFPDPSDAQYHALGVQRGWTRALGPPHDYTDNLKCRQLAAGCRDLAATDPHLCEEEFLIPHCLGGAPRDEHNLWPHLWDGRWGREDERQA